jgi:hypothetical protein
MHERGHQRLIVVAMRVAGALVMLASPASAQDPHPAAQETHAEEIDERPKLVLHGFSNVDFDQTDDRRQPDGFALGQFVLHMSSSLGRKITFFGETSFSARPNGFQTEVERVILRYDVNDRVKISAGRYHTPLNYWNTAFHHGLWLQTTISRPEMIQVGGTFQPVHFVGLLAEGTLSSAALGLGYNVGFGNGRGTLVARGGDAGDANRNRAWITKLYARPASLFGVELGASVYRDLLTPGPGTEVGEWITSGYMALTRESPEVIAEISSVRHHDRLTDIDYDSHAFYIQAAYRLPAQPLLKPYFRFEKLLTAAGEPVLEPQDLELATVGLRYELSGYAALKGEYRHASRITGPTNGLYLQAAWTF